MRRASVQITCSTNVAHAMDCKKGMTSPRAKLALALDVASQPAAFHNIWTARIGSNTLVAKTTINFVEMNCLSMVNDRKA